MMLGCQKSTLQERETGTLIEEQVARSLHIANHRWMEQSGWRDILGFIEQDHPTAVVKGVYSEWAAAPLYPPQAPRGKIEHPRALEIARVKDFSIGSLLDALQYVLVELGQGVNTVAHKA